ncbi:hypothetical protein ES705_31423 [subsurface metagenome]
MTNIIKLTIGKGENPGNEGELIMPEKIEIIYDFGGYADPKIKDVELTRVNGYRTKIIKGSEEKMIYKLKNLTEADVGKIIGLADQKDIDIEDILSFLEKFIKKGKGGKREMTNQETNDEKRFSEEVKIVEKYQEEHPGVSYRDAVLASLDSTEPKPKKEFTAEETKKQEQLKNIENYLSANPRASYSDAVKILLKGEKPTLEEKLIEEYMEKNPGSSYREAVIEALSLLKKEPKKEK